jgi:hypothetical protein
MASAAGRFTAVAGTSTTARRSSATSDAGIRCAPHLAVAYETVGKDAQAAFWGPEPPEASMLAQLARVTAHR